MTRKRLVKSKLLVYLAANLILGLAINGLRLGTVGTQFELLLIHPPLEVVLRHHQTTSSLHLDPFPPIIIGVNSYYKLII